MIEWVWRNLAGVVAMCAVLFVNVWAAFERAVLDSSRLEALVSGFGLAAIILLALILSRVVKSEETP